MKSLAKRPTVALRSIAVVPLQNATIPAKMTAYPNPTTDIFNIDSESKNPLTVDILDMTGKIVLQKAILQGNNQVDLSLFAKGVYFIRAQEAGIATMKSTVQ